MPRAEYPANRRNISPTSSSSSGSGSSTPSSSAESSSRGVSSSSEVSPPSTSSSTPPSADSKAASSLELATSATGPSDGSDDAAKAGASGGARRPAYTSASRGADRNNSTSSISTITPLYVSVKASTPRDVGAIQSQMEAALQARTSETRRSEKTMNIRHEQTLRTRLASSTAKDYYASSSSSSDDEPSPKVTSASTEGASTSSASRNEAKSRAKSGADNQVQAELEWMRDIIAQGPKDGPLSGESLLDAVIAHNTAWRLAEPPSSPPSPRAARHHQPQPYPSRPTIPIATKQLPYQSLASYTGRSTESTPRAVPRTFSHGYIAPAPSGNVSPTSPTRRHR